MKVEHRAVNALHEHPLNAEIYGDQADDELVSRVQMLGIIHPLLVTEAGTVISGHRRLDAATRLGLETVPVLVSPITDPLDVAELLIEANRQRQPNNEQRVREYQHLKTIALKRAAQPRGPRIAPNDAEPPMPEPPENMAPPPEFEPYADLAPPVDEKVARDARRDAARHVGGSERTLEKGAEVVEHIDTLVRDAKPDEAADLRKLLNQRSVSAAWREIQDEPPVRTVDQPPLGRMKRVATDLKLWLSLNPEDPRADKLQQAIDALEAAVEVFAEA
jgi:ParB-like chromosome segregation protein Spo0J